MKSRARLRPRSTSPDRAPRSSNTARTSSLDVGTGHQHHALSRGMTADLWFGLVADSLDVMADAFVYALSLAVVGGSLARKCRIAAASGYLQTGLACFGLFELVWRFVFPSEGPNRSGDDHRVVGGPGTGLPHLQ